MPELTLLCSRPHVRDVDFDGSRFVVCVGNGLNVGGKHLEMGDEVPKGALSTYALRCEYDVPLRRIEILEFAVTLPFLREACARRNVRVAASPKPKVFVPDLSGLTREELVEICSQRGLSTHGGKKQLLDRVKLSLA